MAFGAAVILQVGIIYALASGLASQMIDKLPDDIKADIVKEKPPEQPKTPPPPPPDMVKPPPPFIPPPDIVIANDAPVNTITNVTNKVAPPAITQPATIGRPHVCPQGRWYPPVAVRLGHEGVTTLAFTIGTDGNISNVTVANSSGYPELDDAAVRCASEGWRYSPAIQNGQPITVPWKANVRWKLNG